MSAAWPALLVAIAIEVVATSLLPRSHGFRDPGWTAAVLVAYALSIWLLTVVVKDIPVSIAYAVWSGLGTAGVAVVGMTLLHEPLSMLKAAALSLIVAGVVMLNLVSTAS